jgi:hypothetical protein
VWKATKQRSRGAGGIRFGNSCRGHHSFEAFLPVTVNYCRPGRALVAGVIIGLTFQVRIFSDQYVAGHLCIEDNRQERK